MLFRSKAIISLGMGSDVHGVRVESRCINWVENDKYCLPSEQRMVLDEGLAPKSILDIDLKKWDLDWIFSVFAALGIKYEPEVSTDANAFCCNALIFRTLQALERRGCRIPYIYLHLPCTAKAVKEIPGFDDNKDLTSVKRVHEILHVLLSSLPRVR